MGGKVLDIGIARLMGDQRRPRAPVVGTAANRAPKQATGSSVVGMFIQQVPR